MSSGRTVLFRGDVVTGIIILLLGVIFLLGNLYPDINIWRFVGRLWPVILIIIGLYILFGRERRQYHSYVYTSGRAIGDTRLEFAGKEIGDINTSQVIGDLVIDLRGGSLKPGINHLDISNVIGDTNIYIPRNFPLKFAGKALAGDLRFDGRVEEGLNPRLEHTDGNYEESESKLLVTFSGIVGDMSLQRV